MNSKIYVAAIAESILGILISTYLLLYHTAGVQLICPTTGIINCGTLLSSSYAFLYGIPIEVFGMLFFVLEIILVHLHKKLNKDILVIYNAVGIGVIMYLIYGEYTIGKICLYCTAIHILVVTLFILSVYNLKKE